MYLLSKYLFIVEVKARKCANGNIKSTTVNLKYELIYKTDEMERQVNRRKTNMKNPRKSFYKLQTTDKCENIGFKKQWFHALLLDSRLLRKLLLTGGVDCVEVLNSTQLLTFNRDVCNSPDQCYEAYRKSSAF